MTRKKGPVWDHFQIIGDNFNKDNKHPHVQCNYCSKDFQRAVPKRMQVHLNKSAQKHRIVQNSKLSNKILHF